MSDYGFVYLWFDRKDKRFYVGSHWGSSDDGYVCSSRWMRSAYRQRPQDFKRRILATITTSRRDLLKEERRWLVMIKHSERGSRYFNLNVTGDNSWHTEDDRRLSVGQRISKAKTGKRRAKFTPEALAAMAKAQAGKRMSAEAIAKISASKTPEIRRQVSAKMSKVRAQNPNWDRKFSGTCILCGAAFKGRKDQKYCCLLCRTRRNLQKRPHAEEGLWFE